MSDIQKYTCGFIFHNNNKNIILIKKERPRWQQGKINGIGGKIEDFDKTPLDGWIREVKEESDIDIVNKQEVFNFCRLTGYTYFIEFFCVYFDNIVNFSSKTDECIVDIPVADLGCYMLLPNLSWLIEMAKETQNHPHLYRVINE